MYIIVYTIFGVYRNLETPFNSLYLNFYAKMTTA